MSVNSTSNQADVAHRRLLAREFMATALYLAVVLLAALVAVPRDQLPEDRYLVLTLLGTSFGLVLAHWFAFRLAAHLTAYGGFHPPSAGEEALAQIAGGASVAVLASIPFLVTDGDTALALSLIVLAVLPAMTGAAIARLRGRSWLASGVFAGFMLILTATVVAIKNVVGH
jgi:hypothetical protein